jgi:hypothetical protein
MGELPASWLFQEPSRHEAKPLESSLRILLLVLEYVISLFTHTVRHGGAKHSLWLALFQRRN